MARSVDVYADVLDSEGAWQWVIFRVREDVGCFQGLRSLDSIGTLEVVHGSLAGTGTRTCSCHRQDESVSEHWLDRLKARLKGTT